MTRAPLLALSALALVMACGAGGPADPPAIGPGSQAATAAALASAPRSGPAPTGQAVPAGPPPAAATASSGRPLHAAAFPGRIVVARDSAIEVVENGASRRVFVAQSGGNLKDPVFSPDGRQIAFAYAPPRPQVPANAPVTDQLIHSDIMLVPADGGEARPVVAHDVPGAILETPAWAPDGRSLYFGYYAPQYQGQALIGETIEIRRVELAGGAVSTVVAKGNSPTASPDGKSLVYVGEDVAEGPSLQRVALDGSGRSTIIPPGRFAGLLAPRFSPDGAAIAFAGAQIAPPPTAPPKAAAPLRLIAERLLGVRSAEAHGLPWEMWTVPGAGGEPKQLTLFAEDTPYPAWSADGARLLVFAAGGLYMVDVASGNTEALSTDGAHGGMDWRSKP